VSSPQSGLTVSNQLVNLVGTAFDPDPNSSCLKAVLINQNGCVGTPASGTASWNSPVLLQPGLNILSVTAVDEAGNVSPSVVIELNYFVSSPGNDFFAQATPLTGASGSNSVYTFNATKEVMEPNHAGNYGGKSVWYSYQPPADGVLTLDTSGSTFDTLLAIYTGTSISNVVPVAANDDAFVGAPGGYSLLDQAVRSNVVYHIALDGFGGASGTGVVTYAFAPATVFHVTSSSSGNGAAQLVSTNTLGGASIAPGPEADFAAGSKVTAVATPDQAYQFSAWTGDISSTVNPMSLTIGNNLNIIAQFAPAVFSDGFESGDLSHLGWQTSGDAPWFVQSQVVASGKYAARSGVIGDGQTSSLILSTTFAAGPASFDFKVSSEPSFDKLTFSIDGFVQQQWSGQVGWANYQFSLSGGLHTLNWTYSKDPSLTFGLDAAFIDDLNLPFGIPHDGTTAAHLQFVHMGDGSYAIELLGQASQKYILQVSTDLVNWQDLSTASADGNGSIHFSNLGSLATSAQFYR
ncbi:MAG: InlB B-repeat-containing protein, partial [Limisphaerales bacterium]